MILPETLFTVFIQIYSTMQKRILAIHDLSGFGSGSLMAIIPIMNRYGLQVTVLPTALLSANTCYADYAWLDTTSFIKSCLEHFKKLSHSYSAIYSGFLGSAAQAQIVLEAIHTFGGPSCYIVIDPVMADDGELYSCYDQSMIESLSALVALADLITPNFTEACFLAGWEYRMDYSEADLERLCQKLHQIGAKSIVITSVPDAAGKGSRVLYSNLDTGLQSFDCDYLPVFFPGTGDIFCALLLALILNNIGIAEAIPRVIAFIHKAISFSMNSDIDRREGILLESQLWQEDLR